MFKVDGGVEACAATLAGRLKRRQDEARERAVSLRTSAAEAARVLAAEFGARRAWLFGSLAWGEPHEASDVDILVEGLDRAAAGAAERRVAAIVPARVDLVRVEEAPPGLCERVMREGTLLHDAP